MNEKNEDEWQHIKEMYERIVQSKAGLITAGSLAAICLACYFLFGPLVPGVIAVAAFLISGIGFVLVGLINKGSAIHNFFGSECVFILVLTLIGVFIGQFFMGQE